MSVVANRYIQALLELPKSEEESKKLENNLKELAKLYTSNQELQRVLLDPRVENKSKMDIIEEIFPKNSQDIFIKFIDLLIKENRIKLITEIAEQYEEESQKADKILNIKIISACEIDEKQIQTIVEKYKTMYNVKSINYEIIIDESLLGGVKVMVGNKIYDGSIQTQLNKMF